MSTDTGLRIGSRRSGQGQGWLTGDTKARLALPHVAAALNFPHSQRGDNQPAGQSFGSATGHLLVEKIAVRATAQGCGIGTPLMALVDGEAPATGSA